MSCHRRKNCIWRRVGRGQKPFLKHATDARALRLAAYGIDYFEAGGGSASPETDPVWDVDFLRTGIYRDGQIAYAKETFGEQQSLNFGGDDVPGFNGIESGCEVISCF